MKSVPQPVHPSCQMVCPLPEVVRVEGRLLADHSLVEVDVAQVLGWLFRGTHFLVIVDHPSAFLLDMADIVTTHSRRAHVTNEGKELILSRTIPDFRSHWYRLRDGVSS